MAASCLTALAVKQQQSGIQRSGLQRASESGLQRSVSKRPTAKRQRLQSCQQCIIAHSRSDSLDQPFHRRLRRHLTQATTQRVHAVDLIGTEQLLLATCAACPNVDRRINALLRKAPVELDLAVARTLELLEDHIV